MIKLSVTGIGATTRAIGSRKIKTTATIAEVLHQSGEIILKRSQRYVPVDTGLLKSTGMVTTTGRGSNAKVEVTYGKTLSGESLDYALYVHENPDAYHAPPTCWRYLARAVKETKGTRTSLIKRVLGMQLGGA